MNMRARRKAMGTVSHAVRISASRGSCVAVTVQSSSSMVVDENSSLEQLQLGTHASIPDLIRSQPSSS